MLRKNYYLKKKKYGNKPRIVDGITFDSNKEATYYIKLKMLKSSGELDMFIRQPRFELGAGRSYSADFLNFWRDGRVTIEDVKSAYGATLENFVLKKALVEDKYGIIIDVII